MLSEFVPLSVAPGVTVGEALEPGGIFADLPDTSKERALRALVGVLPLPSEVDRELLLRTPYLVVEGMLLAGVVLGATQGFLYIRHEYEECIAAARAEIAWAVQQGFAGEDILGSGVTMKVEVFGHALTIERRCRTPVALWCM